LKTDQGNGSVMKPRPEDRRQTRRTERTETADYLGDKADVSGGCLPSLTQNV
jgi:hypothetical protein